MLKQILMGKRKVRSQAKMLRKDRGPKFRPSFEGLEQRLLMASDVVIDWNNVLLDAVRTDRTAPPVAARAMAVVHTSIYDAVAAIERKHEPYAVWALPKPGSSVEAAAASAAHTALSALFPAQQAAFDAALADSLAAIPDGASEANGVSLGQWVANQILALRSDDGATDVVSYTPGNEVGDWVPTPPGNAPGLLPQWPYVTPWAMTSGDQFRIDQIPELNSEEYTAAFNEVKDLGDINSTTRTEDQTAIALFWANGAGTATPPGHLNMMAQEAAESQGNTLYDNARMFALLNIALADAAIVSWDAKYETDFWRPITGIRQADTDGNPDTAADPNWTPLVVTPPFPTYTSGHSVFSGAAATALAAFFGTDDIAFTLDSENPAVGARSFTSFSEAAEESAISRLYGGIHWIFDIVDGVTSGNELGEYVSHNFLQPLAYQPTAGMVGDMLVVIGSAAADHIRVNHNHNGLVVRVNGQRLGIFDPEIVKTIGVEGREGHDFIEIRSTVRTDTELHGNDGHDVIHGGSGRDTIFGGRGSDKLFGNKGADYLDGGNGRDFLFGGWGADHLVGGKGWDLLNGGLGNNTYDDELLAALGQVKHK